MAGNLNDGVSTTWFGWRCVASAERKVAGTETRPLRSTLFTKVDRNSSTHFPHAHPTDSRQGAGPVALVSSPQHQRLSLGMIGIAWAKMGRQGDNAIKSAYLS